MNEIVQQALDYLRGMWHRRWWGLAAAWLAAIVGVIFVYRIPDRYEASARVYVDTETLLKPLLSGLVIAPNIDQQVALMSRTLISRPNIDKLIRMTDIDLWAPTQQRRDELIDWVTANIWLAGLGNNMYMIGYRNESPDLTLKVVRSLLTIFVESSLGDKRQDTRTSLKFLDDQIKRYEDRLKDAENRLKDFKIKHMGVVGGSQDYFNRVGGMAGTIESAKLELQAAEQARDAYKQELSGESPTFLPETPDEKAYEATPQYDSRIGSLYGELDGLLRRYTEQHPDVIATKRQIATLEQERKDYVESRRKSYVPGSRVAGSPDRNPTFQQLRLALAEAEANVAAARAKLGAYESQYAWLKQQAQIVPEIEEEYMQLNRDYAVQQRTYEALLSRREQGTMGIDVEDAGGAQFRVIDPPRVSSQPVYPNRMGLLGGVLLLSIAAGLGVSFLVSQFMPIVHDARALRDISRQPILGMVSMLPSPTLTRKRRLRTYLFAGGLGGFFASYGAVLAIVSFGWRFI